MAFLLLIPFFLIRFGLLLRLSREAAGRAAHFAPLERKERAAYFLYQAATAAILICPFFLRVRYSPSWLFVAGLFLYAAGLILLSRAVFDFAVPAGGGLRQSGLYRFSRNPMYVSYFVFFLSCALLTQSLFLLALVLTFQVSAHWIILSEERFCERQFGDAYLTYVKRVRRYL